MDMDFCNGEIVSRIFEEWRKRGDAEPPRRYLGASICGHECDRYLWNAFRALCGQNFDGRMYRLFDRGKREEAVFADDLRSIGCEVFEWDPDTGRQFAVAAFGGHFGGHMDGIATGVPGAEKTPHVVEYKTHNDASFRKLAKEGVEVAKPMHYAQMQAYMGLAKLTRALYLAVNKDSDELYAERVQFDLQKARASMIRVKRIIEANDAPEKCASRDTDFRCRGCQHHCICWGARPVAATRIDCRSCCRATPVLEGDGAKWTCELHGEIDVSRGETCKRHLLLPTIVNAMFADAGEEWVRYQLEGDGWEFINGAGGFTSKELVAADFDALRNPAVNKARQMFNGEIQAVVGKEAAK